MDVGGEADDECQSNASSAFTLRKLQLLDTSLQERGGDAMVLETTIILMMSSFILGLIIGVALARPHITR